ncbi:MAG: hypothetical protein KGR69_09400, partial [Verrucomicrobia bacterium]|nr:hypothetical protein [Verrucomicrobiota bacterium]
MKTKPPHLIRTLALAVALIGPGAVPRAEAEVVLQWKFDGAKEAGDWQGRSGKARDSGGIKAEGPRAPRYPGFAGTNRAGLFEDQDSFLVVKDRERGGPANLRFSLGETLVIEAWVKVKELGKGEMAYLLGKGRHGKLGADLGEDNQNYAVRLKGAEGGAEVGFLFTSEDPANGGRREWHRWWSKSLVPESGWHHVAVVHTFGKKDGLRVLIDGKPTGGVWDLGGATDLGP